MHQNLFYGKNESKFDVIKFLKLSRYGTKRIDTRIGQARIAIHRRIDISFQPYSSGYLRSKPRRAMISSHHDRDCLLDFTAF